MYQDSVSGKRKSTLFAAGVENDYGIWHTPTDERFFSLSSFLALRPYMN